MHERSSRCTMARHSTLGEATSRPSLSREHAREFSLSKSPLNGNDSTCCAEGNRYHASRLTYAPHGNSIQSVRANTRQAIIWLQRAQRKSSDLRCPALESSRWRTPDVPFQSGEP